MRNNIKLFFGFLVVLAIIVWTGALNTSQAESIRGLKVYFLNVGQGDSEYIKTPNGSDILIDGGPDASVLTELGRVMDFGDRRIDLIVLTHPHADHLTGLIEVINRYEIGEVWETGVEYPSGIYDEWKKIISDKKIADKKVVQNDEKWFGSVKFFVLGPLSNLENKKIDNLNNASIISELDFNKFSALFLGDAENPVQTQILKSLKPMTVVKIGHHGSKNALNEDLLKILRPAIAVIEVGAKNTYGHPAPSTISFLESLAVKIYRTDQNGTVEIDSDGVNWSVK